jgi:hypothetical protein
MRLRPGTRPFWCCKQGIGCFSDVNGLKRAGLRHILGSFDEEVFETATEIK